MMIAYLAANNLQNPSIIYANHPLFTYVLFHVVISKKIPEPCF